MGEAAATAGRKILAAAVLVAAAYVLFRVVIGVVSAVAWIIVAVLAVVGIVWALREL